jgi:AbrB family looped-hinge helix DNA binding protein
MEEVVTVSSKGQIVLPSGIREKLSIKKGTKLVLVEREGLIIMKPLRKLSELRGILKGVERPAKEIVEALRKEWEIKLRE